MERVYGVLLCLCGMIQISLAIPFARQLWQKDFIMFALFFGIGLSFLFAGVLAFALHQKVE